METCLNYTGKTAFVSSDERKTINRIEKLKSQHPDSVIILNSPESNDGCLYAKLPASWIKITPPRTSNMTEEQRRAAAERLRAARKP